MTPEQRGLILRLPFPRKMRALRAMEYYLEIGAATPHHREMFTALTEGMAPDERSFDLIARVRERLCDTPHMIETKCPESVERTVCFCGRPVAIIQIPTILDLIAEALEA